MNFIGRKDQLIQLSSLWGRGTAALVTCQGRRRIGKSRLIAEFAKRSECRHIKITGLAPRRNMTNLDQLRYFGMRLAAETELEIPELKSWVEAFDALDRVLSHEKGGRVLVLLDEVSWMGRYDLDFPGYLKDAWDDKLKRHSGLVLVLCGSVSSWIQKNILDSTGFVGRISLELVLTELTLGECVQFWRQVADSVSSQEIFDMLSVVGGVPRYLEEIDPSLTTNENIRRLAFVKSGTLFKDFNQIFNDVFGAKSKDKGDILRALAFESKTLSEISRCLGKRRNGHLSSALAELELAGFVERERGLNPETGFELKKDCYRIRDNYTRFYLRYIEPYSTMIRRSAFSFATLDALPGWHAVQGLQFENLILNNASEIIRRLGLDHSLVLSCASYRKVPLHKESAERLDDEERGCQIDLLIQLKQAMYVVEMKRREEIGPETVEEVRRKISRLPNPKGLSVRPVLVYEGRLSPSVVEHGYFAALIKASDLLR